MKNLVDSRDELMKVDSTTTQLEKTNLLMKLRETLTHNDGEYGSIGEFYIVKCLLAVPDYSVPINNLFDKHEKTCLVNSKEFKRWLSQKNAITWI